MYILGDGLVATGVVSTAVSSMEKIQAQPKKTALIVHIKVAKIRP